MPRSLPGAARSGCASRPLPGSTSSGRRLFSPISEPVRHLGLAVDLVAEPDGLGPGHDDRHVDPDLHAALAHLNAALGGVAGALGDAVAVLGLERGARGLGAAALAAGGARGA